MFAVKSIVRASAPFIIVASVVAGMAACGSSSNNNSDTGTSTTPACTVSGGKQYVLDTNMADAVNPNACSKLMFAKYQIGTFGAVNSAIIAKAANANQVTSLGDSFQTEIVDKGSARITSFTNNLAAFLVTAFGTVGDPNYVAYTGPTMPTAHADLNITEAQYNYFLTEVILPALAGADASDITNCFAPVVTDPNFKVQIIACQ